MRLDLIARLRADRGQPMPPAPIASPADELRALLARARRRWRLRVVLRGLAIVLGGALAVVVLSSLAMERWQYGPSAVLAARALASLAVLALVARWIALPLLRRVPDAQVALYLEEHEPSLDAALVSAVEQVGGPAAGVSAAPAARSPALERRLVEGAVARARLLEARRPERAQLQRASALAAGAAAAGLALVLLGPGMLRQGARLLVPPWRSAEAAEAYAVLVRPGDGRLPRGGDVEISARLRGFAAADAELSVRRGAAGTWERIPMSPGADSAAFVARLFDLDEATQYFVESDGVRSPVHTLEVTDLPAVRRLDLEYRYPAYTGLPPRVVEDGGDVAALAGTVVRVRVTTTLPVRAGRILVEGAPPVAMTLGPDGALTGDFTVRRPGFYHVELEGPDGFARASLDYAIDVIADNPPTVVFRTPGRDLRVTSLEEIFAEATAEDDHGVASLELVYAVNGGAERVVQLYGGGGRARREIVGGHTFYLEEHDLQPGGVVSYYARARDGGARTAATDIYFMEVRPFEREYRQAEQGGGGGGGGREGAESPSALSQRQREIVAATFKTVRDRASLGEAERRDNLSTITLAQGKLRERVQTLAQRVAQRGLPGGDSALRVISEALPLAAAAMREAEEHLGRRAPEAALPAEQRALQQLQRAEAAYREVQVSFGSPGEGGGGGQEGPEQLSDLFELDVDKLRNQYESVDRGGRTEQGDREVDETLERLRALAARQQQENERAQRRAEAVRQSGGASGGGQSQRQLAEETEQAARRLERLARERQSPELAETARRLQDAASAMRRSAASSRDASTAEAAAALDRLQEARRLLDRERSGRIEGDAREAQRRADELAARQRGIAGDVSRLRDGQGGDALADALDQRKEALARDVEQLEGQLDRLARGARTEEREAARRLQDAAGAIRERRIPDKVRYSRQTMRGGSPEYARSFEEQIGEDLEEIRRRVGDAAGALGRREGERGAAALDRARELARGLESLRERARDAAASPPPGERAARQAPGGRPPGQQAQGQEGRQGQGQEGQAQGGGARGAPGPIGGSRQGASAGGGARPLTAEEIRQFAREYRARREGAEALRRELAGTGADAEALERLIRQMRALEGAGAWSDAEELERLQAAVTEGFKEFEFALRRRLAAGDDAGPVLGDPQEVAPRHRALVEEYYRSLGRGRP